MLTDTDRARDALQAIPPDCDRAAWVKTGMAFHAAGGDFDSFDAWSAGADSYRAADCRDTWRSFKSAPGGVSAGALFGRARDHGWIEGNASPRQAPDKATTHPTEPPRKPAPGMSAAEVWGRCEPVKAHPYADKKRLSVEVLKQLRVVLLRPPKFRAYPFGISRYLLERSAKRCLM